MLELITKQNSARGFTLLELMVTLAIAAILASIAAPSFKGLIESQRVRSASNELISSLNFARSEAVTRNTDISVTQASGGWTSGWTVNNGTTVLRAVDSVTGIAVSSAISSVIYGSNGRASAAIEFTVAPSSGGNDHSKCVSISLSGKPSSDSGSC